MGGGRGEREESYACGHGTLVLFARMRQTAALPSYLKYSDVSLNMCVSGLLEFECFRIILLAEWAPLVIQ